MKNVFKGKVATIIIILATFVLAGVAIFTAVRLYQLRQTSISPISPSSKPAAQEIPTAPPAIASTCILDFTLATGTPSATPTATPSGTPTGTPTATPTATPTQTPVAQCNTSCTANSGCPSNLMCYIATGATTGNCRNTACQTDSDCICATATPTPKPTGTPLAELPQSGVDWPTVAGAWIGVMVILGSLLLAL